MRIKLNLPTPSYSFLKVRKKILQQPHTAAQEDNNILWDNNGYSYSQNKTAI